MASCFAPLRAAAPHCRLAWPPTYMFCLPRPVADWRVAGMSYLKYSNLCADMVRSALKEAVKGKAKTREVIYYRSAQWKNGVPEKQGGQRCAGRLDGAAASTGCGCGQSVVQRRRLLALQREGPRCPVQAMAVGAGTGAAAHCWWVGSGQGLVLLIRWRGCWPDCLPYTHTSCCLPPLQSSLTSPRGRLANYHEPATIWRAHIDRPEALLFLLPLVFSQLPPGWLAAFLMG